MLSNHRNIFEELGDGFTLLAFDASDDVVAKFERAANQMDVPLKILRDSYLDDRWAYESQLILVRPDQFVAWVGDEHPEDIEALFRKITGRA